MNRTFPYCDNLEQLEKTRKKAIIAQSKWNVSMIISVIAMVFTWTLGQVNDNLFLAGIIIGIVSFIISEARLGTIYSSYYFKGIMKRWGGILGFIICYVLVAIIFSAILLGSVGAVVLLLDRYYINKIIACTQDYGFDDEEANSIADKNRKSDAEKVEKAKQLAGKTYQTGVTKANELVAAAKESKGIASVMQKRNDDVALGQSGDLENSVASEEKDFVPIAGMNFQLMRNSARIAELK